MKDFYFMTEELWKFLYSIYGGGPIIKKMTRDTKTSLEKVLEDSECELQYRKDSFKDSEFAWCTPNRSKNSFDSDTNTTTMVSSALSAMKRGDSKKSRGSSFFSIRN